MKKQELVNQLANSQDCFFSIQQVIALLNQVEDAPAPMPTPEVEPKGKVVSFTESELENMLNKFRVALIDDIENNVCPSDLVTDDMCSISVNYKEICVECDEFNIGEIKDATRNTLSDFWESENLFPEVVEQTEDSENN